MSLRTSNPRLCRIYQAMRTRVNNPNYFQYHLWGGRGIKSEWNNFTEFFDDMGSEYINHILIHGEKNTQLDRIDCDKNYCVDNCRWVTIQEQVNNRRNVKRYNVNGVDMTIPEIAKLIGVPAPTLYERRAVGNDIFKSHKSGPKRKIIKEAEQ